MNTVAFNDLKIGAVFRFLGGWQYWKKISPLCYVDLYDTATHYRVHSKATHVIKG